MATNYYYNKFVPTALRKVAIGLFEFLENITESCFGGLIDHQLEGLVQQKMSTIKKASLLKKENLPEEAILWQELEGCAVCICIGEGNCVTPPLLNIILPNSSVLGVLKTEENKDSCNGYTRIQRSR